MSTAIEQAISYLIQAQHPVTVPSILPVYMHFAGLSSTTTLEIASAIIAFEHAMDKHPAPPLPFTQRGKAKGITNIPLFCKRLYHAEVEQLRKEYWESPFGMSGGMSVCSCAACGRPSNEDRCGPGLAPAPRPSRKRANVHKRELYVAFIVIH